MILIVRRNFARLFIEGGFIAEINDQNVANGNDVTQRFGFPSAPFNNWLEDGELVVEVVNSFSVSVGQGGENLHRVQVQADVLPWLHIEPVMGEVVESSSENLSLLIDAEGLYGGVYHSQVILHSNDVEQQQVIVPVQLTVVGAPEIMLSATSLNFGQVIEGQSSTQVLTVTNIGWANLLINELLSSDPAFSTDVTAFELAPGQSKVVQITFSPPETGFYNGFLSVLNNDSDAVVNLWGEGVSIENPQPVLSISPEQFDVTLDAGASTTENLSLQNLGEGSFALYRYG